MSSNTSSSNTPNTQLSSTSTVTETVAYINQLNSQNKPPTIAHMKAKGDIKFRMTVLWFVGLICAMLTIFGCSIFMFNPGIAKDVWVIIGPILSSAITGTIAYLTGEKQNSKK